MKTIDLAELHLNWGACAYKGKTYRSYSLAKSVRKNGRNGKENVLKLGKLSDGQVLFWRRILEAAKNPHLAFVDTDNVAVTERFHYLDAAAVSAAWDEWELDRPFDSDGLRDVPLSVVARILAVNRCLDPAAKSKVPEWHKDTALPWLLDAPAEKINASRIFRELDRLEDCKENICGHLFEALIRRDPDSMSAVFYDLSSASFTGNRCALVNWGHCKEGYGNHVVLALVVNREGLPFYWETLPGNTADSKTVVWLLQRLEKRFKIKGTTLVFDRGMVSDDNLELLEEAGINYISAMDRNQIEGLTGLDFKKFSDLSAELIDGQAAKLPGFTRFKPNLYYCEVKVEGPRRYLLCFNPQLFKDQRQARMQAVEDFKGFAAALNSELLEAKKARSEKSTRAKFQREIKRRKLRGFIDVALNMTCAKRDKRTYRASVVVDEAEMLRAGRLDGFWLLVTNHSEEESGRFSLPAEEAIEPYRDKVVIEASFRDIKSFVEVSPTHVWTEKHVKAHFTICVLAHLINRTLDLKLRRSPGDLTKDVIFHERLYKELSGCKLDRIEIDEAAGLSTINLTKPTAEQKELLDRLGFPKLLNRDIVDKAKSADRG